ncbi:MAG TPA: dienelactone hydrolase family protein [Roseiarcus sp.]
MDVAYAWRRFALAAIAAALPAAAPAEQRVTFPSIGASSEARNIAGYLTKPSGSGPFPAVALLHSCLGLPVNRRAIGETIAGWGYVALFVDDFSTRGLKQTCTVDFPEASADAYGALAFLAKRSDVDPARIAAVGFSQGADTALAIAAGDEAAGDARFRAAAAFYPPCANRAGASLHIPTLIVVGAKDEVTPAADCEALAKAQPPAAAVSLVVLPGAAHGFDMPDFAGGKRVLGMWLAYDRDASRRALNELRKFLASALGR